MGCSSDDQLPPGTSVNISPGAVDWQVTELRDDNGDCIFVEGDFQDNIFIITVTDRGGRPIGEANLSINLSPSNSTSNPLFDDRFVFHLYDDLNSNGVVDHPAELVSGSNDPILYETETEEFHGTKSIIVRTDTSCGGSLANLSAFAGEGFASVSITTTAINDDEP